MSLRDPSNSHKLTDGKVVNARIFKGKMPDPAGRRRHNKLPPVPLYFVRCDCGYSSDHLTRACAELDLAEHARRSANA